MTSANSIKRRFQLVGGTLEKFWQIERAGMTITLRFGRLGTNGRTRTMTLHDEPAAKQYANHLVLQMIGKGYVAID